MQNVPQLQKLQTYLNKEPSIVCHHQEEPMARATMKKIIIFQKSKNTLCPPTTTHTDSIHPNGPVKTIKCRRKKLKRPRPYAKWIQRLQTYHNKVPNIVCHHHEKPRARATPKKIHHFQKIEKYGISPYYHLQPGGGSRTGSTVDTNKVPQKKIQESYAKCFIALETSNLS